MADEEPTTFSVPPSQWAISDEENPQLPGQLPGSAAGFAKDSGDVGDGGGGDEKAPLLGAPSPSAPPLPTLPSAQAPYAGAAVPLPPPPAFSEGPAVVSPAGASGWCFCICLLNLASVALLVGFAASAAGRDGAGALGGAFAGAYALYLALCFCSPSGRALRNVMSQAELDAYVQRLRRTAPTVEATIQCFHYETRHHDEHFTDKDGRRRHRRVRTTVRVNTHFAREQWRYSWVRDVSGPPVYRPEIRALRVRVKAVQDFTGAPARAAYDAWREGFFRRNSFDVHQERTCKMSVAGLESYVMLRKKKGGLLSSGAHALAALLMLGGLYEAAVLGEVPSTRWLLVKQLHA